MPTILIVGCLLALAAMVGGASLTYERRCRRGPLVAIAASLAVVTTLATTRCSTSVRTECSIRSGLRRS